MSRHTTIGTGGPARAFARPESLDELAEVLAWADAEGVGVAVVGLGSNVLVADDGVDALVLRLAGVVAAVEVQGDLLVAGGGATNAVCLHRARDAGLGGLEYRRSGLEAGEVVAAAEFILESRPVGEIKARVAEMQAQRKAEWRYANPSSSALRHSSLSAETTSARPSTSDQSRP